jgi:hypothetical protein
MLANIAYRALKSKGHTILQTNNKHWRAPKKKECTQLSDDEVLLIKAFAKYRDSSRVHPPRIDQHRKAYAMRQGVRHLDVIRDKSSIRFGSIQSSVNQERFAQGI